MKQDLLIDALNCAFRTSFQRLFEVLLVAAVKDDLAFERFHNGLDKAMERYDQIEKLISSEGQS